MLTEKKEKRKKMIGHKSFSTYIYSIFFKREREREQLEENIGIFVNQEKIHSQSVFSQFWGENILAGPGR